MYYVLGVEAARSWVLSPEGDRSRTKAEGRIRWQGPGFAPDYWRVCTWDAARKVFVDEQGRELTPDCGPYTVEAWAEMQAAFR